MGATRRLPMDLRQEVDKLKANNWRARVSTGALPAAADDVTAEMMDQVLARLDAAEQRLDALEGVDESG